MSFTADEALARLRGIAREGRLAHAYVVVGPVEAVFGKVVTPWLADLLGADPEGHPDVHHVRPVGKLRVIRIDSVRELLQQLYQTTMLGGWKVAVFHEAERLNSEAANAFLKTLEEPPAKTLLILLTTRPEALLPTIQSRCLSLRVRGLEQRSPEPELVELGGRLARLARGDLLHVLTAGAELAQYLGSVRSRFVNEAQAQLREARQTGVAGEGLEDLDKMLDAQAETHYIEERRYILTYLLEQLKGRDRGVVALFDETAEALHRSVPEAFALDRLFVRLFGPEM
jgi:DNA polymerase-3 subunit delta'